MLISVAVPEARAVWPASSPTALRFGTGLCVKIRREAFASRPWFNDFSASVQLISHP
jgi:hypothetical protein